MKQEKVCLRCGQCCYLKDPATGKITDKKCKHLIRLESGNTLCRIYNKRLGQDLGNGNRCIERKDDPNTYPGCPLNKCDEK